MNRNRKTAAAAAGAALLILALPIFLGRDWIPSRAYRRAGARVIAGMSPALQAKYGEELHYTLDKFWDCYRDGACSRNDMTDVMDRLRSLGGRETINDRDVFDLIGVISRIYSDRFDERHRRQLEGGATGG